MTPDTVTRLIAAITAVTVSTSCYGPPEERARRDLEVGRDANDVVEVTVEDGLGVVRSLSDEGLALWGNAPRLAISVTVDDPLTGLRLEIDNAVVDAELDAPDDVGVREETPPRRTARRYLLDLPRGTSRLVLGPPGSEARAPFRFAVLSDIQRAIDTVSDIYQRINEQPDIDFVLGVGDLTSQGTPEQLGIFERELEALDAPYFATLGNHELGVTPPAFHDFFGRGSAHFRHRGVAFSLVDSASATVEPMVYDWLDGWMAASRDTVHVVAMHVPPTEPIGLRNGSFASRNEAAKLLSRLARGGVDLTLYGHLHTYLGFENAGIEAHISGGGGAIPERFDGVGRHFIVIAIDPDRGVTDRFVVQVDDG